MTEDPTGEEIPELLEQLEGSLNAPDVEALHAVHTQRQAARKRTLGAAGVFVAVLALSGGVLALNRDDTTTTVTADDAADSTPTTNAAVADDSAPVVLGEPESFDSLREFMMSETWHVGDTAGSPKGFEAGIGQVWFDDIGHALIDGPKFDTLSYSTGCDGSAYSIDGNDSGFTIIDEVGGMNLQIIENCIEPPYPELDFETGTTISIREGNEPSNMAMGIFCHRYSRCNGDNLWSVELIGTAASGPRADEGALPGEPTRLPVGPGGIVRVDPNCLNVTSVQVGDDRWYATTLIPEEWHAETTVDVIVEAIGGQGDGWLATDSRGLSAQFGNTGDEAAARSCMRWEHFPPIPSTTTIQPPVTTTTLPLPAGPPTFAPSEGTRLSGQWEVVRMWDQGVPFSFEGYTGQVLRLNIVGRRLGGHDGCNGHGGGIFYATTDGRLELQPGTSTDVGCPMDIARILFTGALQADQWGLTDAGNLVLEGDTVTAEFELTEELSDVSVIGLSAPLNTIWNSDVLHDYDSLSPNEPGIEITMLKDLVLLGIAGCDDKFVFDASYGHTSEGPILLERSEDPNGTCQLTEDGQLALDALARADYFASADGGVMFWDGPAALAVFANE